MTKSTITREWLQHQISAIEAVGITDSNTLTAFKLALAALDSEPVAWTDEEELRDANAGACGYLFGIDCSANKFADPRRQIMLYRHAQPAPDREQVRREHAEWSQGTFGNVGPVGPLKHLSKEALEAAEQPGDLSEWADMQFLLWDAQRRAGVTDEQITQAMIEKLAVNKQRSWPETKEGEPRLHIKEQPAPVVPENCVTAEHRRVIEMLLNVCGSAFELADDSCQQDVDGEECHVVTSDAFQKLSDALDEIENTLPTEDIDRPDVFLAWSAMPRAALKSLLQAGGDEIGSWDNGKYPPSNEPAQPVPDFETVLESLDYDVRCNIRESVHVYQASKATYDACRAAMLQTGNHAEDRCMLHVWTNPDFNAESSRGQSDIFNANGWHARFYEQNKPTKFPYDYNPGNSPVIPDGYVMVPKEPTEEMIAAAMNCDDVLFNSDESFCVQFGNIYEAMLAAAPQEVQDE